MSEEKIPYQEIRNYYNLWEQAIIIRSMDEQPVWVSPYNAPVDWGKVFTPIETAAWHYIRAFGRFPLYPQYPVGKYFTDFGNPYFKVAIECDGKEYHRDKIRDYKRDCDFKELGWTVYRVNGADCNRVVNLENIDYLDREYDSEEIYTQLSDFYENTVDGLIKSLAVLYCNLRLHYDCEYNLAMSCLEKREIKIEKLPF